MGSLPDDKKKELEAAIKGAKLQTPLTAVYWLESDTASPGGTWNADVYWSQDETGRSRKVHRQSVDPVKLVRKVLELEQKRAANQPVPAGAWTFEAWNDYWIANLAGATANENTVQRTYEPQIRLYLNPRRGGFDLPALRPSHFSTLYQELKREGLAPGSIGHVHATARRSLNAAVAEGLLDSNPVAKVEPPTVRKNSPASFDDRETEDIVAVLESKQHSSDWRLVRRRVRHHLTLMGGRQGEMLGLRLPCYDRDTGLIDIKWQLQRKTYRHGCTDARACAEPHHRGQTCLGQVWTHGCERPEACARPHCGRIYYPFEERERATAKPSRKVRRRCEPGCTRHARACPDRVKGPCVKHKNCRPCGADCVGHAIKCPQRVGGLVLMLSEPQDEEEPTPPPEAATGRKRGRRRDREEEQGLVPKSEAGKRRAALPEYLRIAINEWLDIRAGMRLRAGSAWEGDRWQTILCDELGRPLDPRADWAEWGITLNEAGVRYREPHVGRRQAAKAALIMGVDRRVVMAMFGWSSEAMITRYQDVDDELLLEAADRVGGHYMPGSTTGRTTGELQIESIADVIPTYETA
jgi:site-specific recombinase XerD